MESAAGFTLDGVSKRFARGGEEVVVFDRMDLALGHGDFVALMGPSGSGKSTLLNLLAGIDRPDGGSIAFDGVRIDTMSNAALSAWRAHHVGFVFQSYNLLPMLSAERNVELPLTLTRLGAAERRRRVALALDLVGVAACARRRPAQLSGGQQQRVAIARAIVADARVLLCDEPTGNLDRAASGEVLALLQTLNQELGKTIVMVTHDQRAADAAARVMHLDKGHFVDAAAHA
jgi:putative ABC transport system ATP-binding protein